MNAAGHQAFGREAVELLADVLRDDGVSTI